MVPFEKSRPSALRQVATLRPAAASDDTRARLIAAARDVFLEGGVANFSLREVARRVGVSGAAVYRHFEDKEALVNAACAQGFELFSRYLVRALGAPTPLARLLTTSEQYRLFGQENPLDYRFIFMSPTKETCPVPKAKAEPKRSEPHVLTEGSTFRFLVDRVRECMDAGILAKDNPEKQAVLIWGHVHGLVSLRLSGHLSQLGDDPSFALLYRESVERLLTGLAH